MNNFSSKVIAVSNVVKEFWISHGLLESKMNVIYNASYNGTSLDGSTLYVYGLPVCSDCAKGVIQVGIKRVVMPQQVIPSTWSESWALTRRMFDEAGVKWEFIKND